VSVFICPVCGHDFNFADNGKSLVCTNGHNFDKSAKGYVNLLTGNNAKQHGDDKLMCRARHDFLAKDYYRPLLDTIINLMKNHTNQGDVILDAGCGEGWYTSNIIKALPDITVAAVDISKEALSIAKINGAAVASVYDLPLKDNSVNMTLNVFSPFSDEEYRRVLTDNGLLLYVIPLEHHLYELKSLLYDKPYLNEVKPYELNGYDLLEAVEVKYSVDIENNQDIRNLFAMTPYYYTTGKKGHDIISNTLKLSTRVEFCVLLYRIGE
jgi:Methylase involved in ubiquinone/menaquinone biosynthesis